MEQWTLDAVGVLIISPTAGGGGLGRLRRNVDSEGGKYTSASPRCTCYISQDKCNWQFFSPEADSIPWVPSSLFHVCTPILDFWYLFHIQTNEFLDVKISQYYAFAVFDIVAPWNRPQERRCMPGLQGPQPSFMSKIPICECFKDVE